MFSDRAPRTARRRRHRRRAPDNSKSRFWCVGALLRAIGAPVALGVVANCARADATI